MWVCMLALLKSSEMSVLLYSHPLHLQPKAAAFSSTSDHINTNALPYTYTATHWATLYMVRQHIPLPISSPQIWHKPYNQFLPVSVQVSMGRVWRHTQSWFPCIPTRGDLKGSCSEDHRGPMEPAWSVLCYQDFYCLLNTTQQLH